MVTYYRSDATLMDFDVYQFSKEGYPDTLADFVTEEAAEYNGTDIATDVEIKEGVNRTKTVKDRPRRAYLKRVENGTQAVYEARRKAKRKAEVDAQKAARHAEDIANGVHIPCSGLLTQTKTVCNQNCLHCEK